MNTWDNNNANKSAKIFDSITPVLEHYFGGKIYSTESHDNQFAKLLDYKCAIDALVDTDDTVFGIAHRVKYSYYEDFTIRKSIYNSDKITELDKISRPGIKPRYHVQTVCIDNKPVVIAIAKTSDLLYAINHGIAKIRRNPKDNYEFYSLDWFDLISSGINVDIIKVEGLI